MRSSGFGIVLAVMFLLFLMMGGIGRMAMIGGGFIMTQMLFPFLLIAVIMLLVRPRDGWRERRRVYSPPAPPISGTPEEVLRQRYARGELSRDQYQDAIMELLKGRYVTGEISLEDYEARVATLIGDSRQRRLQGDARAQGDTHVQGDTKGYV